jgi:S1-C subfamily serine protease
MPDYEENVEGVLVSALSKGGPAEKAGLKAGDRIVEIAGKTIGNLNAYMAVMGQQRPGQALSVTVIRAGQKMRLKVVPE